MSLLYRSTGTETRVAEIVVSGKDIAVVLTDKTANTTDVVVCMTVRNAERLVEQFLHPKMPY